MDIDPREWLYPLEEGTRLRFRYTQSVTPNVHDFFEQEVSRVEEFQAGRVEWELSAKRKGSPVGRTLNFLAEDGWRQILQKDLGEDQEYQTRTL